MDNRGAVKLTDQHDKTAKASNGTGKAPATPDKAAQREARKAANQAEREALRAERKAKRKAEREIGRETNGDAGKAAVEKPGPKEAKKAKTAKANGPAEAATETAAETAPKAPKKPAKNPAKNPAEKTTKKATKKAAPKSEPAPSGLLGASQTFNILIVAQAGRLARQAVLFAASLRQNAPDFPGRLIVAEPAEQGAWAGQSVAIDEASRKALLHFGAEIVPFTAQHFGRAYPYGNKIEALSVLPAGEPFVFFDSDTLVLGPLDRVAFDFSRPSASMRRTASWPEPPLYGPGYTDIWKSLYDRFGLDFESSLDATQLDEHWERYLYFNAGWFFGADPREFGGRFTDWARTVRHDPGEALAAQSLEPWLDQVVLPLVVHSFGGGRPGAALAGLDGDITCHYRNLSLLYARESDATVALIEGLLRDPLIAPLYAEDEAAARLVQQGEGRSAIRPLFPAPATLAEQPIRHRLKQAGLWFR